METQVIQKRSKPLVNPARKPRRRTYEAQQTQVQSILQSNRIQPKLRLGQPNDKYEQEADRVAEQVMRMPELQSSSSVSGPPLSSIGSGKPEGVQRACAACAKDDELIQTKVSANTAREVTPEIGADIQSLQGGGQPLSKSERSFFEPRIGADFSHVRVHNDAHAANIAQSINVRAFTYGQDVVFGAGEYSPNTSAGKKLLAHELTHVVQQGDAQLSQVAASLDNDMVLKKPIASFPNNVQQKSDTFTATDEDVMRASAESVELYTSTCCPDDEQVQNSTPNKFTVHDVGATSAVGGTVARYVFGYTGHADDTGPYCQCSCCAFVQFVRGFFEINGTRIAHTLPGSGLPLSPTVMRQDSPVIPHSSCSIPGASGGMLTDTPGLRGISATDNITIDLEFDARTVDTCDNNAVIASRNFHLVISGTHPRSFSATGQIV